MVTYITTPKYKLTSNGNVLADHFISGKITLKENTYWAAELMINNGAAVYPSAAMYKGVVIKLEVKDAAVDGAYTTLFEGRLLSAETSFDINSGAIAKITCVGYGYALEMMNVAEEYGSQSRNPARDTIQGILTNNIVGIIPRWVNYIGGSASHVSGHDALTTTYVENLTGSIPYIVAPWKPALKFIDDLCDLHTAISELSDLAGPHWIVDHSKNFRLKRVGASQTGWDNYYGGSQSTATLTVGVDFTDGKFQDLPYEANIILYYGVWRRPTNGDIWTENTSATYWDVDSPGAITDNGTDKMVGAYSIEGSISTTGQLVFYTPAARNADWNLGVFSEFQNPTLEFYFMSQDRPLLTFAATLKIIDENGVYKVCDFGSSIVSDDQWYHIQIPLGNYWKQIKASHPWTFESAGTFDWAHVDVLEFRCSSNTGKSLVDGLHFGGDVPVLRVARQEYVSDSGALGKVAEIYIGGGQYSYWFNPAKFKVITDNVGKDDSLVADDDTGLMAQLAKAELMRCTTTPTIGQFTTLLNADVLPGQCFYIGKAYRITQVTQNLPDATSNQPPTSHFEVTSDVINSHTRMRYDDVNKLYESVRPSWQDRQASSIKAGEIDIRITPLEKAYAIGYNPSYQG